MDPYESTNTLNDVSNDFHSDLITEFLNYIFSFNQMGRTGVSMSTVGVDIADWTFEKKSGAAGSGSGNNGPLVFRTWDFGGQTEYYATHQYFLSKRSLYLVVWKITDGERGMNEIQQWLINIQVWPLSHRCQNKACRIGITHFCRVSTFVACFLAEK